MTEATTADTLFESPEVLEQKDFDRAGKYLT